MSTNKITTTHLVVWVISAMAGPIVFYADGNWTGTLIWGSALSLLVWASLRFGVHWNGTVYHIVQCLWLSVVLSQLLDYSADCWPTGERTFPVVPLVLLTLAALSTQKGTHCAANGISVLFWILALLLGIVIIAGIPELNVAFLEPRSFSVKSQMMLLYLIPSVVGFLEYKTKRISLFVIIVMLGVCISAWICGILSQDISEVVSWPFYESAKSVQIFDVAKRLEALVSVGVTVGNYALYSLVLCAVGDIGDRFGRRREAVILSSGIAASLMLSGFNLDCSILVVASIILWVFLPFLGVFKKKTQE